MNTGSSAQRVNRRMQEYYDLIHDTERTASASEIKKRNSALFSEVYMFVQSKKDYSGSYSAENDYDLLPYDQFVRIYCYCRDKWEPGKRAFSAYFSAKFANEVKDEAEKRGKELKKRAAAQETDDDGGETDIIGEISDGSSFEEDIVYTDTFNTFNNIIKTVSAKYAGSPKIFYTAYFYTEFVTKCLHERKSDGFISELPEMTFNVINRDFAAFYLTGKADSAEDVIRSELKALRDFTGDPADNVPCGYDLANIVYVSYIGKSHGKSVSESAVSQQRKKFRETMKKIIIYGQED